MTKIDTAILKSLILDYGQYIVIIVLCFFLFKSCQGEKELSVANNQLKKNVIELTKSADKYVAKNNALNDTITLLEKQKQKVEIQIVEVEKTTKKEAEKAQKLSTKQIANYYQNRYKLPVAITQYGIALSDSISKKNIVELAEKDGCFEENKLIKQELVIEEQKGSIKDTINSNLTKANILLHKANFEQRTIISNTEKSFKKERAKKTFWQVTTGAVITAATYLIITK